MGLTDKIDAGVGALVYPLKPLVYDSCGRGRQATIPQHFLDKTIPERGVVSENGCGKY